MLPDTKSLPFYLCSHTFIKKVRVMVFNATYNNISVILWQSVLSHCQTLSHNVVSSTPRLSEIRTNDVFGYLDNFFFHFESKFVAEDI
jgi:hypothetical protein